MKVFITGSTGFIGAKLAERLLSEGNNVTLLVRNPSLLNGTLQNATVIKGDITDCEALQNGMKECDLVFHLAAFTDPSDRDPELVKSTNVSGTINILESAAGNGVRKVIITSTAGTLGYSRDGKPVHETTNPDPVFNTLYEKTKAEAEKLAAEYAGKGLDVTVVNPTRVYGPGKLVKSNSVTKIINLYISGLWRFLPAGGKPVGNYAYIDDVVEGHLLAAEKGRPGERYILGGQNLSFSELFSILGDISGKKRNLVNLPAGIMKSIAAISMFVSKITGNPPLITTSWVEKYLNDWIMSSRKAENELGYTVTPFRTGAERTIEWLKTEQNGTGK